MNFIRPKKVSLSLDMAPLIDVVFQLLIFFMLSSSFSNPALTLELPKAVTADQEQDERAVISVEKDGSLYLDSKLVSLEMLKPELEARLVNVPNRAVHLRGDQDMPYKFFVEVMDTARQVGARQINIVHQRGGSA